MTHEAFLVWLSRAPERARSWLRHPALSPRCTCGAYGMPWPDLVWRDGRIIHFGRGRACQPDREVVW